MVPEAEAGSDALDARVARLIDRLLVQAEAAAASGAWDRASALAEDILSVAPADERATAMLERARAEWSMPHGQRAFVSVLFSDIVQSSELTEVADPEIVRDLFKIYQEAGTAAIQEMGGHVLQFQGDGIVACFGYPTVHEDDAKRAVLAALGLVERMTARAAEIWERYGVELPLRIGIHTGTVVVASPETGSGLTSSDIVGAALNVAARLQGEAAPDTVVISDTTFELVSPHFEMESIGLRDLRGIARSVEVYRVVTPHEGVAPQSGDPSATVAIVGRDETRRQLRAQWDRVVAAGAATQEWPPVVMLRGPAGIGKSRLAADLSEHVRAAGGTVLYAGCSPYHENVALWPMRRMLEQSLGLFPEQDPAARVAEVERSLDAAGLAADEVMPLLAPLLGLDVTSDRSRPEVDPLARRAETLAALAEWLHRFASLQPTLLLVEDVHWADPTTMDLLGLVATDVHPGVMVLVTGRTPLATLWSDRVADLELGPLHGDDAANLVAEMLPDRDLTAEQRGIIVERAGGVPLFLQELARNAGSVPTRESLPPRLHELLAARVRAPGVDLHLVQLAATFGAVFNAGPLRELAGRPVVDALLQLQAAGIVEQVGDAGQDTFRFRHVLLRDAAYETQVLEARRATHGRIAQLLDTTATTPGDLAITARHFDLAGDPARAVPAYMTAAMAAQAEASHNEARGLLDRALELLAETPQSGERELAELSARMLRTVSVSSLYGYGFPDVLADFERADEICRRHNDRPEVLPARIGIWSYMLVRGDLGAAGEVLDALSRTVDSPDAAWFATEIRTAIGWHDFYRGDLGSARKWLEQAWAGYEERPEDAMVSEFWPLPHDPRTVGAVALACIAALEGDPDESAAWERRAHASAEEIGFPRGPFSAAFVTVYLSWLRMISGDTAAARAFGERTLEIAAQHRFEYFTVIGRQYVLLPEPGAPVDPADLAACEAAMDLVGHGAFRAFFLGLVARNYLYLDEPERALSAATDALGAAETSGELVHVPDLLRLRAEILTTAFPDRLDEAATLLVTALEVGAGQGSLILALRAANDLGRLPPSVQPPGWEETARAVLDQLPADSAIPEVADARNLLTS
ncbi:MAG: AAA family ATPase [Acidimicrobiia bacterium]